MLSPHEFATLMLVKAAPFSPSTEISMTGESGSV